MGDRASRAMEDWKRERPDLDALPMVLLGRLSEAAQRVGRDHLQPFYAAHGLHAGEFDVLATLRRSGAPYRLSPTVLYAATMVTSGAMTGRIDRLERAGRVVRLPDPDDRRGTLVALTPEGFDLIDRLIALHVQNEQRVLADFSHSKQEQLARLLAELIAALPQSTDD